MPVDHKEKAFETAIEHHLITSSGYVKAEQAHFDQQRAIDPTQFMPFLKDTQAKTLEKLDKLLGNQTETTVLDELCKAMDSRGTLDVLRHGFKCFGKTIEVAYFRPRHGMNPDELARTRRTGSPSFASCCSRLRAARRPTSLCV